MGYKLDTCSCYKNTEDTAIEVELKSGEKPRINLLTENHKFSINIVDSIKKIDTIKSSSLCSRLSNIKNDTINDSIFIEKNDLKPLINNINFPEIIIQSLFRGYLYRKKFNDIYGIKENLLLENSEIINSIEKNFIQKSIIKSEQLFIIPYSEDNWKKYYKEDIMNLLPKGTNTINSKNSNNSKNKKEIIVSTKCLLSKYQNKDCLYKGTLNINNITKNKVNKIYNINNLNGKGVLYLKNGKKYEGNFINGHLNGWCRFINSNGICYEGLFIDGILNGKGEIIKIDENRRKNIFRGDIKNFKKEGKGEEKTSDYTYEGEFLNDIKHGKGKINYNNTGDYYEGIFTKGEITGNGFYSWKNKHMYNGDFVAGKMHGKGLYVWPDGNEYEGEYVNNVKEGYGVFKWRDGRIYKGKFKNGRPHGKGILTINGISFDAIFENGKFLGEFQMSTSSNLSI